MRKLDHPNTVLLYETFEDEKNVFLVMELCSGGELLGFILESGRHTEAQAVIVMRQVFQAVLYLHSVGICHRDIKHANTLLLSQAQIEDNVVKIVDFGLACCFTRGEAMRQCAGTAIYVAPQVLECKYDHSIDLWSCGVLLYILLCGYPPFRGDTDAAVMNAIRRGNYSFPSSDWTLVSQDAKSLIRMLLKMKVKERITAEGALKHSWIQEPPKEPVQLQKALERMRKFVAYQRQTQNLNPEQIPEEDPLLQGIPRGSSQSSIATRIPQTLPSAGTWLKDLQRQFSAFTAAVGSAMTSKPEKKRVEEDLSHLSPPAQSKPAMGYENSESISRGASEKSVIGQELPKGLTPSQVFREKHIQEDEPVLPSQLWPRQVMEQVLDLDSLTQQEVQQEVLTERLTGEVDSSDSEARSLPGQALMNLSSTAKPVCPFDDILPPALDPNPAVEENAGDPDSVRAYVGQQLEFWSKTACRWIPCEVINVRGDAAIMVNVKPNTWLTTEDQARRVRACELQRSPEMSPTQDTRKVLGSTGRAKSDNGQFCVGQPVEYLSISAGRWIPSRVTGIDEENSIQLDVKPGCWIPLHHQKGHVRLPGLLGSGEVQGHAAPSTSSADLDLSHLQSEELEYYSLNLSAWIPCRILQQDAQSGCAVIDVLPSAWITPAQQATYLRAALQQERLRIPLIGDKVVYFSESHMRWIPTIITDVGDADEVELEIKPGVWISRDVQKRVLRWCSADRKSVV